MDTIFNKNNHELQEEEYVCDLHKGVMNPYFIFICIQQILIVHTLFLWSLVTLNNKVSPSRPVWPNG